MAFLSFLLVFFTFFLTSPLLYGAEKLVVWTSSENVQVAIKKVAKQFEADYGVKVDVIVLNKDLTGQFKTAAISNKGPDIFSWAHDVVGELASSGLIEPINLPKTLRQNFFSVALDAFMYKGKLYGYPYDMEAVALIYNKNLIREVPSSMEKLLGQAKRIGNSKKRYGFLYDIGNFFFSFPLLAARGGYVFKSVEGKLDVSDIGLANSGAIEGGTLIKRMVAEGVVPQSTDRSVAFNKMKKGELAMTIDGPWAVNDLKKAGIPFGVAPIPSLNGSVARPFVGVHGFMVRRSSKKKDLAFEFVEKYLVSKKGVSLLYEMDPRGPSRKDVMEELKDDRVLAGFLQSAKHGIPMPNVPQMGAVWAAMGAALNHITTQKKNPEDALKLALKQILTSLQKK